MTALGPTKRTRTAAVVLLAAITAGLSMLLAVGVAIWVYERGGCWYWQETFSRAGGTLCDGETSTFNTG